MTHGVRVIIDSYDRACGVDTVGLCADDFTRDIERGDGAFGDPHETVESEVCVKVHSRDRPGRVNASRKGRCGTRRIEGCEGAVGSAQKAVIHEVCVKVRPCDSPCRVDTSEASPIVRARGIKRGKGAVGRSQVAVCHSTRVGVESRDCA